MASTFEIASVAALRYRGASPLASTIIYGQNRCKFILTSNHADLRALRSDFGRFVFRRCIWGFQTCRGDLNPRMDLSHKTIINKLIIRGCVTTRPLFKSLGQNRCKSILISNHTLFTGFLKGISKTPFSIDASG